MASAVEVVLVPGYWVGPGAYDTVKPLLEQADHRVTVAPLPSTGQLPGPTNNLQADVAAIRAIIESRVEQGADVLVVAHSAGGFLAAHATQDLGKKARADAGKKGGVVKFAFLAGALFPPGHVHGPAPFMDIQGDKLWCKDSRHTLFSDLPDAQAEAEVKKLGFQPGRDWDGVVEYAGWMEIPSAYLVTDKDACLPAPLQEQIAGLVEARPLEHCDAGHCVMISQPQATVNFLKRAISSV